MTEKYDHNIFCPFVLFYVSIRGTAVRNINIKNESHSSMLNDWIMIYHKLSIPLVGKEMKQVSDSLPLHPFGVCLFSGGFGLMTACDFWRFSVFSVWFGVMVAVFSQRGLFIPCMNADVTSRPWMMWTTEPEMNTYCKSLCQVGFSVSQTVVAQAVKIFTVNDAGVFFLSFALNVWTSNSLAVF